MRIKKWDCSIRWTSHTYKRRALVNEISCFTQPYSHSSVLLTWKKQTPSHYSRVFCIEGSHFDSVFNLNIFIRSPKCLSLAWINVVAWSLLFRLPRPCWGFWCKPAISYNALLLPVMAICPITERDTIKPVPGNDPVSRLAVHLSMSQNWDKRIKCDPVSENL